MCFERTLRFPGSKLWCSRTSLQPLLRGILCDVAEALADHVPHLAAGSGLDTVVQVPSY